MLHEIDLSRADLNLLVLFEAVLKERNVARAAERLNLSPSAVSHGLGRLRRLLNDPVFRKTPKGVLPTARAMALAEPIAEILSRMRQVIGNAEPFDPKISRRRFTIGAQDGVATIVLPGLLKALASSAPNIDLSVTGAMPQTALADLDAGKADIAIQPLEDIPPRFASAALFVEEFAIAMRKGHPLGTKFTLEEYCAQSHIVVSATGDPYGAVDRSLESLGMKRRVALAAPNFMIALAIAAETDLLAAMPVRQLAAHAARFNVIAANAPMPWGRSEIRAIVPQAALMDEGVAWLFEAIKKASGQDEPKRAAKNRG